MLFFNPPNSECKRYNYEMLIRILHSFLNKSIYIIMDHCYNNGFIVFPEGQRQYISHVCVEIETDMTTLNQYLDFQKKKKKKKKKSLYSAT